MRASTRWSAGLAAVLAMAAAVPTPVLAQPKPREELYWFDWWELEDKVWPITMGRGVTVAVIDREVKRSLPDLRGAVHPNVKMNRIRAKTGPETADHGTAMTALIVGQGRGTGMTGVAPEARALPVVANGGLAWAKAIRYVTDHRAKVINMSLGSESFQPCPGYLQDAISYAVSRDVVVVASAGNEGRDRDWRSMPANCPGVLAVGGLDGLVRPWGGTTPGEYVTAAAPAVHVPSIDNSGTFRKPGLVGTSAAAALTSGVVALVRSRYPDMPAREVVQRILATSKDVGKPGWDDVTGYGLVRPYRALTDKVPPTAPNPVYASFDRSQENNGKVRSESRASKGRTPSPQVTPKPQASSGPLYREPVILLGLVGGMLALCLGAVFGRVNVKQR